MDNLIIIKGGAYNDIKKALRQWVDLYSNDLEDGLTFQLYKNGTGNHLIRADKRLDNERFFYLINYLNYPEGIEYKIDIRGFTTGKEENQLKGKQLLVYISPTDKDYDNVFLTTSENESYKVDFGGRITEERERNPYCLPGELDFRIPETITVLRKENFKQIKKFSTDKLAKRFKIISATIFAVFGLTFLFFKNDADFLTINYAIAFAVWWWMIFDHKMLQKDSLYFSSAVLGLVICLYGYVLDRNFSDKDDSSLVLMGTTMPILFLVLQRPLRFAFKVIMKREPVVERPVPSFADFIYIFLLLMATLTIPTSYFLKH